MPALAVKSMLRAGPTFERVRALDLSASGARLEVSGPLPSGQSVTLHLNLAGRMIGLLGRVAWSENQRLGVTFEEVRGADAHALNGWIHRQPLLTR